MPATANPSAPALALLRDWQGSDPAGWLMSEKLDGWRVLWTGREYVTRGGQVLDVPASWLRGMPDFPLDGELFAGRGLFARIPGMIAGGFDGLSFRAFDAPIAGVKFRDRARMIASLALPVHCQVVRQVRCRDEAHLLAFADSIVAAGGEGCVIRDPRAKWMAGRSGDVLRWVPQCPSINRV